MSGLVDSFMEPSGALTDAEAARLTELEGVIQANLYGFRQVCSALWEIKRDCLFRGKYKDFPDYIRRRWDGIHAEITASRLYQLAKAGEVLEDVEPHYTIGIMAQPAITNERQARALAPVSREARKDVYQFALEQNNGRPPSGRQIEEARAELLPAEEAPRSRTQIDRFIDNYRPANKDTPSYKLKQCLDSLKCISAWSRQALEDGKAATLKLALEQIGNEADEKMQEVAG